MFVEKFVDIKQFILRENLSESTKYFNNFGNEFTQKL